MEADAPKKIGKYDVVDLIGRGEMGVIYKAVGRALGRLVVAIPQLPESGI